MATYWQADDACFECLRDKEILTRIVAEVAGEGIAEANGKEPGKVLKRIVRDHLGGANGRAKVENWVPKWMAFPPSAYTERGGVGSRSEEHTSELQSLMRIAYAVFCLKKKNNENTNTQTRI